jgi:hypothetical protein
MTSEKKESRTDKLLRILQVPDDFRDPRLPSGVFSHSQYSSWVICGKAYEYKYVQKIQTPEYIATTNGSAVHGGIEHALITKMRGESVSLDEGRELVGRLVDEKAERITEWSEEMPNAAKLKAKAVRLYETFYVHALPKINPVAIEKGFAKKLGDVPVIGYIDLVDEVPALVMPGMTPEEAELAPTKQVTVDFKTARAKWSKGQLDSNTQLTMYAHVQGTPDVRVDQLVDLKGGAVYHRGESTRTPGDANILIDHLNEVAEYVRQGIFPKADITSWACNKEHCSFWGHCRGKYKP